MAVYLEKYVDVHDYEGIMLMCILVVIFLCFVLFVTLGIWIGSKVFFRTRTVYVMQQLNTEEHTQERSEENHQVMDTDENG